MMMMLMTMGMARHPSCTSNGREIWWRKSERRENHFIIVSSMFEQMEVIQDLERRHRAELLSRDRILDDLRNEKDFSDVCIQCILTEDVCYGWIWPIAFSLSPLFFWDLLYLCYHTDPGPERTNSWKRSFSREVTGFARDPSRARERIASPASKSLHICTGNNFVRGFVCYWNDQKRKPRLLEMKEVQKQKYEEDGEGRIPYCLCMNLTFPVFFCVRKCPLFSLVFLV